VFDCAVSRALLRFQVATFGDYRPHLKAARAARPRAQRLTRRRTKRRDPGACAPGCNRLAQTQMRESFLRERAGMMFTRRRPLTGQFENGDQHAARSATTTPSPLCVSAAALANDQQFVAAWRRAALRRV
jgi:hypothetical protein